MGLEKVGDGGSPKESGQKEPWAHRAFLAATAGMAMALLGGGREVKGAEDPRPVKKDVRGVGGKESQKGKELSIVHNLKMFRFQGTLYVVDPQDGNRVYRLKQGNRYDLLRGHPWNLDNMFNNCTAPDGRSAAKPHSFGEPFIIDIVKEEYAGKGGRDVLRTYIPQPHKGGQLMERGEPIWQKDVNPTFTRVWEEANVQAGHLIEAEKKLAELSATMQPQKWTVIVRSVDEKDKDRFTDHKGRVWVMQYSAAGAIPLQKGDLDGNHKGWYNPQQKRVYFMDNLGRVWRMSEDWKPATDLPGVRISRE